MAYVITDACIKDYICASECATAAIAPASAGDPAAAGLSQLFINPDECIDCGSLPPRTRPISTREALSASRHCLRR